MKKSVFVLFAIILMILPMVLAVEINVKTLSGQTVTVFLREPGAFDVLDFHQGKAIDGVVTFTSDFTKDLVDLQVNVGQNGNSIIIFKRPGIDATGVIELYLPSEQGATVTTVPFVEEVEEIVEEVVEEEVEEIVEEEVEEVANSAITVNAVSGIKDIFTSKKSYYIVGMILALFAIAFIIQIGRNKIGSKDSFRVVKFNNTGDDSRLEDAEKKLAEAKEELDDIRDRKKKLAEAKARFQKDKEELSRLE